MELFTRGGESKDETDEGEAQSSETDRLRLWVAISQNLVVELLGFGFCRGIGYWMDIGWRVGG